MPTWVDMCSVDDVDPEDVIPVSHGGVDYAIYRTEDGDEFFATDGHCSHERQLLCDGLVMGDIIECPKHNGRFNFRTGEPQGPPVLVGLTTYPTKVEGGRVFVAFD